MGGAVSFLPGASQGRSAVDKALTNFLMHELERDSVYTKILLLGTGNSGKSTILKQFQYLNQTDFFNEQSLLDKKNLVSDNIITGIKQLFESALSLSEGKPILKSNVSEETKEIFTFAFEDIEKNDLNIWQEVIYKERPRKLSYFINKIWEDIAIQEILNNHLHLLAKLEISIGYFMNTIVFQRIIRDDYIPIPLDILYCRQRTTGVIKVEFSLEGNLCQMFDVGGQRNERSKWISHFDNVDVVIFVVSLADYCKSLYEDESQNSNRKRIFETST